LKHNYKFKKSTSAHKHLDLPDSPKRPKLGLRNYVYRFVVVLLWWLQQKLHELLARVSIHTKKKLVSVTL